MLSDLFRPLVQAQLQLLILDVNIGRESLLIENGTQVAQIQIVGSRFLFLLSDLFRPLVQAQLQLLIRCLDGSGFFFKIKIHVQGQIFVCEGVVRQFPHLGFFRLAQRFFEVIQRHFDILTQTDVVRIGCSGRLNGMILKVGFFIQLEIHVQLFRTQRTLARGFLSGRQLCRQLKIHIQVELFILLNRRIAHCAGPFLLIQLQCRFKIQIEITFVQIFQRFFRPANGCFRIGGCSI